jgi:hypothetical protein
MAGNRQKHAAGPSRRGRAQRSSPFSMFEALERRYLFSFGLDAPTPAVAAIELVETAQPGNPPPSLTPERGIHPSYDSPVLAAVVDQADAKGYVREEFRVTIVLEPHTAPVLLQAPAGPVTYESTAEENRESATATGATDRTLYVPFVPVRDLPNFSKMTANLINRFDGADGAKPQTLLALESRPQPAINPALNSPAHQTGAIVSRLGGDPPSIELQLRRPMEAVIGSAGSGERLTGLPNVANFSAEGDVGAAGELTSAADAKAPWFAVASENGANIIPHPAESRGDQAIEAAEPAAPWRAFFPLLPQGAADAEQLSEAFQAVFSDLEDLGDEIVSSLASSDRFVWGLGAAGIAYYVAGFRLPFGDRSQIAAATRQPSRELLLRRPLTFARLQDL